MDKTVTSNGACSRYVRAARGITAGSAFATIELRLLLIRALDIVARVARTTTLTVYVDDVAIEAVGTAAMLAIHWFAAMRSLVACFVALRLEFSGTKIP